MSRSIHIAAVFAIALATTGMTLAPVISEAAPQRKPGGGAAVKARPAPSGNRTVNHSGNRAASNSGNRSVRNSANTNINNAHINNNNVNVNRDVNVNVNNGYDHYHDYHDDWDDHWHPVATAAAIGVTAAVVGSIVSSVPPSCSTVIVNGISYTQCGSTWYQPQYAGTTVQYVVVNPPR